MDNGQTIARESDDASWKQASVSKIRFFPERVSISVTVLAGAFKLFQFRSISFPKWSNLLSLPFSTFLFFPLLRHVYDTLCSVSRGEHGSFFPRARWMNRGETSRKFRKVVPPVAFYFYFVRSGNRLQFTMTRGGRTLVRQ